MLDVENTGDSSDFRRGRDHRDARAIQRCATRVTPKPLSHLPQTPPNVVGRGGFFADPDDNDDWLQQQEDEQQDE
jgi:hypothetical protein